MDDFDSINLGKEDNEEFVPLESEPETIPFDDSDDDTTSAKVSHSPLNLGREGSAVEKPIKPIIGKPSEKIVSSPDRITGVKTFFAKLHAGAIEFIDTQITDWLRKNPGVVIKRTNTVAGMVIAKKTEPNIIITIWY